MENRIRQLREKRGLTQETLAIELEITPVSYTHLTLPTN